MQHRIVLDRQADRFSDGNAVSMGVMDDVVFDQHILIEHLLTGAIGIDHLIAHEDGLCPVARTAVEYVAPNDDVRGRACGAVGPELDHVPVKVGDAMEVVQIIAFDKHVIDGGEVKPVASHIINLVAGDHEAVNLLEYGAAQPGMKGVALDGDVRRA